MNTKKIIIDGQEVEIYASINDEEIEDNRDLFLQKELLEDTLDLKDIVKNVKNGDNNE